MTPHAPHYQRKLPFTLGVAGADDALATALDMLAMARSQPELEAALAALRALASAGSPAAALALGRVLLGTDAALAEGVHWLRAAAQRGEHTALHLLGLAYFHGRGVQADHGEARRLQEQAAKLGVVDAQFELSLLLAQGIGGERDPRAARRWEAKAADAGHARACLNRGARLASSRRPDFTGAIHWYARAAEAGSAEAASRLGVMYLSGQGVERDEDAGRQYLMRAAELRGRADTDTPEAATETPLSP